MDQHRALSLLVSLSSTRQSLSLARSSPGWRPSIDSNCWVISATAFAQQKQPASSRFRSTFLLRFWLHCGYVGALWWIRYLNAARSSPAMFVTSKLLWSLFLPVQVPLNLQRYSLHSCCCFSFFYLLERIWLWQLYSLVLWPSVADCASCLLFHLGCCINRVWLSTRVAWRKQI